MNKVIITGRLARDPEVKVTNDSSVARFTVAVDRRFKKDGEQTADFVSCVAFGKSADFISKYFGKGKMIAIDGRIQTGSYTNKDGQKVFTTDVVVDNCEFCGGKGESGSANTEAPKDTGFMDVQGDADELPFG